MMFSMWSLLAAAQPSLPEPDIELSTPSSQSEESALKMIYTGQRTGVASEKYPFPSLTTVQTVLANQRGVTVHNRHDVMVQEQWMILSETKKVEDTIAFLQGAEITCGEPTLSSGVPMALETTLWSEEDGSEVMSELSNRLGEERPYHRRICINDTEQKVLLVSPIEVAGLPQWELSKFEFRRAYSVDFIEQEINRSFDVVGEPMQEISRIVARIAAEQSKDPNLLFVDSGSFLDGSSSVKPGGVSIHRSWQLSLLDDLDPAVLAPGHTELTAGPSYFKQEIERFDLPYIATNWKSEDQALQFEPYKIVERSVVQNGNTRQVRIGFVAVLDPELENLIPHLSEEGVRITDPVQEAQRWVDEMNASSNPPDIVIALTTASPKVMGEMRRKNKGIDILIGDVSMATLRVKEREVDFLPFDPTDKGAPVTFPMDGLSTMTLQLAADTSAVEKAINRPVPITSQEPIYPEASEQITLSRSKYYADLDTPLLTPTGQGMEQKWSQEQWSQAVCESVRTALRADTVLLREVPLTFNVPGVITEKQVADSLAMMDVMEVHYIQGSRLQRFLDQSYGQVPIACGAVPGSKFPKPRGRAIDPDRLYRVVTTDRTRLSTSLKQLIPAHQVNKLFDAAMMERLQLDNGEELTLRKLVVDSMRSTRDTVGLAESGAFLLQTSPKQVDPLVLLRARNLSLNAERFQGMEDEQYAEVPETMATNPSSSTIGLSGDVAVEYLSQPVKTDLRYRASYAQLRTNEGEQEVSDDWMLSSSVAAPGRTLNTGGMRWMPYVEVLYDSEFSPTEQEDGTLNSQQSDLSLTMGLSSLSWKLIRNVKIGALANRDMARLDEKPTEYGGSLQWDTRKVLMSYLIWTTSGMVQLYANTPDDDASDLRWRLVGQTKLSLPVARYMSISLYGNGLGVQGRTEANDSFGIAWNMGCSLDVIGAFEF